MPKTVLIILAAVVALIVIVVLTGMRYLRADDEDDFDDDVPAEHGRSRNHPAADRARSRQRHTDARTDDRQRERVGAARAVRPAQGRADRRGIDQRGQETSSRPGGSSRRGDERPWREDQRPAVSQEGQRLAVGQERNGRSAPAGRDERIGRGGRRDRDISEPMAAVARSSRSLPARAASRGDDYDSQPGRRVPDYDRDQRDSRDRRDSRTSRLPALDDEYASRRDSREPGRDRRDSRVSRDRSDIRDSRPAASRMDDGDRDERDRRSATRPNTRPDARKNGAAPDDDVLPAVKPRQSRGKRDDEGDWPSNEWDEVSDVDFWTELASDGPFSAQEAAEPTRKDPAKTELARTELARTELARTELARTELARTEVASSGRRGSRADRETGPDRDARPERSARQDSARQDRHDSRISEPVTRQLSRQGRELDSGILPAARHREVPADSRPAIADDDPLTSPSFPRIAGDDSRSYRRSRPGAESRNGSGGRLPAEPPSYPSMPRVDPVRGIDGASTTRRHSLPAASADALTDGYRSPASASDPYGPLGASSSSPSYEPPAARYGASATASYSAPSHSGGYEVPGEAPYGSGGYQAAGSYPADGTTSGYQNGSRGYLPPAANGNGFAAETSASTHRSLPPAHEPYPSGPGSSGYHPAASYSLPPSYGSGLDQLAADYPANGYQPGGYQDYGAATSASGSHQLPEPGYAGGSYSGGAEHSLPASLPAGQPDPGYPVYPAPVPTSQNGYGAAAPQLPGYDPAPYQNGGYDPAGYPVPASEQNGYAGADPYAVDPYGQHGYGGNGY